MQAHRLGGTGLPKLVSRSGSSGKSDARAVDRGSSPRSDRTNRIPSPVGIRSSLGLPLRVGGRIVGVITFAAFRSTRKWPDDLIARLKLLGEVMAQVSMRKRAETALQASEERWRSMFEASNLGIAVIDENLHYVATNAAFQAMLGYSDYELQQLHASGRHRRGRP